MKGQLIKYLNKPVLLEINISYGVMKQGMKNTNQDNQIQECRVIQDSKNHLIRIYELT
jgi:hypothetical protein